MIELTEAQRAQLQGSECLVVDPGTKETYVLLRTESYERLRLLAGETVFTTADTLDRIMADDDANDPFLADLQRKYAGSL